MIDWWHEELGAENFEHSGLLNTYILVPNLVYGISEKLNLAFNVSFELVSCIGILLMSQFIIEVNPH